MKPKHLLAALAMSAALILTIAIVTPAPAADLGAPAPQRIDAQGNVKSPLSCFGGLSIGANLSSTTLEGGGTRIDIGAQDIQGGVEGGCDWRIAPVLSIGGIGRYSVTNPSASLFGTDASYNGIWQLAAKATYHLNAGADVYGLLGFSGATFKFADQSDAKRGLMFGAGLEVKVGDGPVALFGEWNRTQFKSDDLGGVSIKPSVDQALAGVRVRF